jgi:hypothetical protein
MLAGQVIVQGVAPLTVTRNEQLAVPLDALVAVQVTTVVPSGKAEPDDGLQVIVKPEQLLAVGCE